MRLQKINECLTGTSDKLYFKVIFFYRHEKMISGMYMGELARLVIVKCVKAGLLFNGQSTDMLMERGRFFTKYVSEIESDEYGSYTNIRQVFDEFGLFDASEQDFANVKYICKCVSTRAAHLVSAGIAGLINKMNEPNVTVSTHISCVFHILI